MNKYQLMRKLVRARRFFRMLDNLGDSMSAYLVNIAFYRGKVGDVDFNPEAERDGYIVVREFGDQRNVVMDFRIQNRWLVKHLEGKQPANFILNQILSQSLVCGMKTAYIVWGEIPLHQYSFAPIHLPRLPEPIELPPETRWMPKQDFGYDRNVKIA